MDSIQLYGYSGRMLRIDLGEEKVSVEKIEPQILRKFLGGVGYGIKLLYDELPACIDPLGPENKLVFTTGPLTGTGAPGSGFAEVCFKSPLTGIWSESKCGGDWGGILRKAGYDFLVIEGKATTAKYVVINNGKVEIRPAEKLKGHTTSEKEKIIRKELKDEQFQAVVIGPAGEKMVRFANIMLGGRSFGRCGAGAVMGSKNILAVAVKGNGKIPVARPDAFKLAIREANRKVLDATGGKGWAKGGTTGDIPGNDELGDIPTKNWRSNSWGKGKELYEHFENFNLVGAVPCYKGCFLRCGRLARVVAGRWKTPQHEGCEYESICAFTFFVLNEDMDAAVHATYLCNEYGMDTISTGATIAFAMDCYQEGMLGKEDAGGLDLTWGNPETIVSLVKKIANREGIAQVLGEGTRRAARAIGRGSDALAIQTKGLEGPAHDPRASKTLAILFGLGNRGMCHIHPFEGSPFDISKKDLGLSSYGMPDAKDVNRFAEEGKGKAARRLQDFGILADILGICKFYVYAGLRLSEFSQLISSLTGWDMDGAEILSVGERVYNLQRMFNIREGITRVDDALPNRVLKLPESGRYSSIKECEIKNYDLMLEECYEARGWDKKTGAPKS